MELGLFELLLSLRQHFLEGFLTLSLLSCEPRGRGRVRGQEGAEGFTPKSVPLGRKSGVSHREKKGNTCCPSARFRCLLRNQSSCKTVSQLKDPSSCHRLPPSRRYCGHADLQKKVRRVSSLNSGGQTYPSFSGHNPRV